MATPQKPATPKRKPAKRGPTKAAALKALGLTQEDLDAIKALREQQAAPSNPVYTEEEHAAKVAWAEDQKTQDTKPEEPQTWFVRNLRGVEVGIRLERQQGSGKKRFDLKPRGQRGDLKPLEAGDLNDSALLANLELGVIEIITAAEAKQAIQKQAQNEQVRVHPAMAMLRNELGEEYAEGAVKGADEYVDEGVVVAHLNPVGGEFGEIQFDRANKGSFNRATGQAPESGRTLGGNPAIISDGFAAARAADEVARSKNIEGPAAGLGGIQTVVVGQPKQVVPPKPGE